MNIQSAINQMRFARRMGKITGEVQCRVMRRIRPLAKDLLWQKMMALRAEIDKEVAPLIRNRQQAYTVLTSNKLGSSSWESREKNKAEKRLPTPKLEGFEFTAEWFKMQDEAENPGKAERRQIRLAKQAAMDPVKKAERAARKAAKKTLLATIQAIQAAGYETIDPADLDKPFTL